MPQTSCIKERMKAEEAMKENTHKYADLTTTTSKSRENFNWNLEDAKFAFVTGSASSGSLRASGLRTQITTLVVADSFAACSTMSSASPPNDNAPATFQFQFQQPFTAYPMSQAQQQYQQLATAQQATTPSPAPAAASTATIQSTPQPSSSAPAPSTSGTASGSSTQAQSQSQATQPQQSRSAAEQARKDRTLAEFMLMLDDYEPLVRAYLSLVLVYHLTLVYRFRMK